MLFFSLATILVAFARPLRADGGIAVSFWPDAITELRAGEEQLVEVAFWLQQPREKTVPVRLSLSDPSVATLADNASFYLLHFAPMLDYRQTINVTIRGIVLGRTSLFVDIIDDPRGDTHHVTRIQYPVPVMRSDRGKTLSWAFTISMTMLFIVSNFLMGTQLEFEIIKQVVKKPIGPSIGFCCQYAVMPLMGFFWALLLLRGQPTLQFGLLALGCAPGGGNSNFWTLILSGNIDLSVTMTFFSSIAALVMMPFWLFTLGRVFFAGKLEVPLKDMTLSTTTLIVPASLGMVLTMFKPSWRGPCNQIVKAFTIMLVVVYTTFGIYANTYIFRLVRWNTMLAGCLLPVTGYLAGFGMGKVARQTYKDSRTIAVETGVQNATIAILLCRYSLPEPDSDLVMVVPFCVLIFTSVPLFVVLGVMCCFNQHGVGPVHNAVHPQDYADDPPPLEVMELDVTRVPLPALLESAITGYRNH